MANNCPSCGYANGSHSLSCGNGGVPDRGRNKTEKVTSERVDRKKR